MSTRKEIPPHVLGLQRDIDSGCDDAVPILADALEDEGDPDAARVFRAAWDAGYRPGRKGVSCFWVEDDSRRSPAGVPTKLFSKLYLGSHGRVDWDEPESRWYFYRAQAYADLGAVILSLSPKEE